MKLCAAHVGVRAASLVLAFSYGNRRIDPEKWERDKSLQIVPGGRYRGSPGGPPAAHDSRKSEPACKAPHRRFKTSSLVFVRSPAKTAREVQCILSFKYT